MKKLLLLLGSFLLSLTTYAAMNISKIDPPCWFTGMNNPELQLMVYGEGIGSKVALGITLVFFIVFFNVYQGVREVSPNVLASARMLGANKTQLLRFVYLPSAMSWVFSSLHSSVGMAFVGAVVGEYLGSASGVGYLILQAESTFDINTVMAGILVLTAFALVLDWMVSLAEHHFMKWQPKGGKSEKL